MTATQEQAIRKHGEMLQVIFPSACKHDPVTLCKKLRRLEAQAHKRAEDYCNGTISTEELEARDIRTLDALIDILAKKDVLIPGVFINHDPRGYSLKISDEIMRRFNLNLYTDWGGYGILAPEIGPGG